MSVVYCAYGARQHASAAIAFKLWTFAELTTPHIVDGVRRGFTPNRDWRYLY